MKSQQFALLFFCFSLAIITTDARKAFKRNQMQLSSSTLLLDDFSSATNFASNINSMGGYAGDDGTCGYSLTSDGLSLTNTTYCYYFTLFSTCLSIPANSTIKVSFSSPPPAFSFRLGLQTRNSNCTKRQSTFSIPSSASSSSVTDSVTTLSFPSSVFVAEGASLDKLHGLLFDTFDAAVTIRRIEVVAEDSSFPSPSPSSTTPAVVTTSASSPQTTAPPSPSPSPASTIVIDSFTNAQAYGNNTNDLGGYASDDGTCRKSLTTFGLSLAQIPGCYYYSLFPTCFSASASAKYFLKISLQSPNTTWAFSVSLQNRDSTCKQRDRIFSISSDNMIKNFDGTYITLLVPLDSFVALGASLDRLHGWIIGGLTAPVTLRRIELISDGSSPSTSVVIDGFVTPQQVTDNRNNLGGYASDDGSCSRAWSADGLALTDTAAQQCYYYTLFSSCYSAPASSVLKFTLSSPPQNWTFIVGLQTRDANCQQRDKIFTISTGGYAKEIQGSSSSVSIPLADFVAKGATLDKLHGIVLSALSSSLTIRRIELASPSSSPSSIVIDAFNDATLYQNNLNALGGFTDDDDTCGRSFSAPSGVALVNGGQEGCYFYTLFSSCYEVSSSSSLKISLKSPAPAGFTASLEVRDATCAAYQSAFSVNTAGFPSVVSGDITSITIPMSSFNTTLTRLHGFVFSDFGQQVTFVKLELELV